MNIGAKADHVRGKLSEGRAGGHHCHWPGCDAKVPPAAWGCRRHWYMLPQRLRNAIWRAYRPGQEVSKTPSRAYIEVAREVQDWIAANHPPAPEQIDFHHALTPSDAAKLKTWIDDELRRDANNGGQNDG